MQRIEFRAMGCQMLALLDNDLAQAKQELALLPTWFEEWEQCLSRFRADSELSHLNRQAGKPVEVSDVMWKVAQEALRAAHDSDGIVVPTLLGALEAAGYDRSFEQVGNMASSSAKISQYDLWQEIETNPDTGTITLPEGCRLDFGGIAKGWAAHQAARKLSKWGSVLVDAGGDIAISGPMNGQNAWPIAISDPFARTPEPLLLLRQGGIATSGRDYRRWKQNNQSKHHIIDPRTNQPAETDILTATVVAPSLADAEVAAKTVLILGAQAGLQWIEDDPLLAALVVTEEGEILYSQRIQQYLWTGNGPN